MELPSSKNKSVYNIPEEMAPDRAEFVTYAGEFWKKSEDGTWVEIDGDMIPAGSDVFVISTTDITKSAPVEVEELSMEESETDKLVQKGEGFIPGVVGASSQAGVIDTSAIPGSGEGHGEDDGEEE